MVEGEGILAPKSQPVFIPANRWPWLNADSFSDGGEASHFQVPREFSAILPQLGLGVAKIALCPHFSLQ